MVGGALFVTHHPEQLGDELLHALRGIRRRAPRGLGLVSRAGAATGQQRLNAEELALQLMQQMGGQRADRRGLAGQGEFPIGLQQAAGALGQLRLRALQPTKRPAQGDHNQGTTDQEDAEGLIDQALVNAPQGRNQRAAIQKELRDAQQPALPLHMQGNENFMQGKAALLRCTSGEEDFTRIGQRVLPGNNLELPQLPDVCRRQGALLHVGRERGHGFALRVEESGGHDSFEPGRFEQHIQLGAGLLQQRLLLLGLQHRGDGMEDLAFPADDVLPDLGAQMQGHRQNSKRENTQRGDHDQCRQMPGHEPRTLRFGCDDGGWLDQVVN